MENFELQQSVRQIRTDSPRIVLCGAVRCTENILRGLFRHGANVVAIGGVPVEHSGGISGYVDMGAIASVQGISHYAFRNINEPECVDFIRRQNPDIIFVTGLSQIVKKELMGIPRIGTIGFHPTLLPKGRGRAPLAWLAHDQTDGAATFFQLGNGVDDGPIFVQERFAVDPNDHASDVESKMLNAIDLALDRWLPKLIQWEWNPIPQDETLASYNEIRRPDDGVIDWTRSATEIYALIRAASRPHPGAYTFVNHVRLTVWRANVDVTLQVRGVPGRILRIDENSVLSVQTGNGILRLEEIEREDNYDSPPAFKIGMQLGYTNQNAVNELYRRVLKLEQMVEELKSSRQSIFIRAS